METSDGRDSELARYQEKAGRCMMYDFSNGYQWSPEELREEIFSMNAESGFLMNVVTLSIERYLYNCVSSRIGLENHSELPNVWMEFESELQGHKSQLNFSKIAEQVFGSVQSYVQGHPPPDGHLVVYYPNQIIRYLAEQELSMKYDSVVYPILDPIVERMGLKKGQKTDSVQEEPVAEINDRMAWIRKMLSGKLNGVIRGAKSA